MALLQMINAVRGKLREERIASISTSDLLTTEIIDLINDAGSEILEGNDWEFDVRHDGRLWYPSSQSGTGAEVTEDTIIEDTSAVRLVLSFDADTGEVFDDVAAIDLAGFRCSGNRVRARVIFPGATSFANTSWIISDVDLAISSMDLTLATPLKMDQTADNSIAWTTYANELVLPTTVKDVLSVRHEDNPIDLVFVDREAQFDKWVPRSTDHFSTTPEVVAVGGTITSTARSDAGVWTGIEAEAAVTGPGCMVWPIPSADVHLEYSYRVQHADLSTATGAWSGVPQDIIHAIEWKAFQLAQLSGIQNNPEGARESEREVEKRVIRAMGKQSRQPNRRRRRSAFGASGHSNPRRRWATQTISAPS